MFQDMYQDLVAQAHARTLAETLSSKAHFYAVEKNGRKYWYARVNGEKQQVRYIGKETPELLERIRNIKDASARNGECEEMVRVFLRSGYPAPSKTACDILQSLSTNGFFRLRGVLIGSVAFPSYHAMFGMPRFSGVETHRMGDLDIAMFHSISLAIPNDEKITFSKSISDIVQVFAKSLESDFEQVLDLDNRPSAKWMNKKTGMFIDLLTPFVPPEDSKDIFLPSIRERANKTKFLDFLIYNEMPSVVLYKSGIAVNVPEPGRFAIHKLLVSARRLDVYKRNKDMTQAVQLLKYLLSEDGSHTLELFSEAWDRGPKWRRCLKTAIMAERFPESMRRIFKQKMPEPGRLRP